MNPSHRLDLERRQRLGMVEAIWSEHKTAEQIVAIIRSFEQAGELSLATRISDTKANAVISQLSDLDLRHYPDGCCLISGPMPAANPHRGLVAVVAGGTSDQVVATEAQLALACHGIATTLVLDVGVAGLHRLLEQLPQLAMADALIVCAGMEGALPTVIAGLLPQPVIGVPVAVGYGVSAGGLAALNGMLASCAPGLTVVNIDNGYGAAMAALRILNSN